MRVRFSFYMLYHDGPHIFKDKKKLMAYADLDLSSLHFFTQRQYSNNRLKDHIILWSNIILT